MDRARTSISVVRVRYAETDKMGVVYYAHYLVWFEIGRTDWLRETGWTYRGMESEGFALPVIESHCEYKQGARYDDEVEVRTQARLISPVRLAFDYVIARRPDAITIGPPVVRAIKRVATVPLDVHLMIEDPDRYI